MDRSQVFCWDANSFVLFNKDLKQNVLFNTSCALICDRLFVMATSPVNSFFRTNKNLNQKYCMTILINWSCQCVKACVAQACDDIMLYPQQKP